MRKNHLLFLAIFALFSSFLSNAQGVIFANIAPTGQTLWYYQPDEAVDSVWVVAPEAYNWGSYTKPSGDLVIPDNITRFNTTYYVEGILSYAFIDCAGLRSVVISDGIPVVQREAFKNCTGMTDLTLGSHTMMVYSEAFKDCRALEWIKSRAYLVLPIDSSVFDGVPNDIPVYVPCGKSSLYSIFWDHFTNFVETVTYTVNATADYSWKGSVEVSGTPLCDSAFVELYARPADNYHFVAWNDGNTDNPRVVELSSDTNFVATFSYGNLYTVTVLAEDSTMGSVSGSGVYEAYSYVDIAAVPCDGYRFVRWNDGDLHSDRRVYVTHDITYVAYFEPTTGILDADTHSAYMFTDNNCIIVCGAMGRQLKVYDILGHQIVCGTVSTDRAVYPMPSIGVFFAQLDNDPSVKVVTK